MWVNGFFLFIWWELIRFGVFGGYGRFFGVLSFKDSVFWVRGKSFCFLDLKMLGVG